MNKIVTGALASIAMGATLSASAFTIDLAGQEADGEAFNIFTFTNDNTNAVSSITFDFVYDAGNNGSNISWGSELLVQLGHLPTDQFAQVGTAAGSCAAFGVACVFDLGFTDDPGIFTASGTIDFGAVADGSGDWEIIIADSFDDAGIDGVFLDGSNITVNQVPVPAAVWFMGSALLSLFGVRRFGKRA